MSRVKFSPPPLPPPSQGLATRRVCIPPSRFLPSPLFFFFYFHFLTTKKKRVYSSCGFYQNIPSILMLVFRKCQGLEEFPYRQVSVRAASLDRDRLVIRKKVQFSCESMASLLKKKFILKKRAPDELSKWRRRRRMCGQNAKLCSEKKALLVLPVSSEIPSNQHTCVLVILNWRNL